MIRKLVIAVVVLGAITMAGLWLLAAPRMIAALGIPDHTPDLANGELMFWAAGCGSCHAAANARDDDRLRLGGGQVLTTRFGRFHVPNISPDPDRGIGAWTLADFVNAMKRGIAPGGVHLYPAFPYTSYQRMRLEDIIDLKAFLDTLPPVADVNRPHELPFPFSVRRGLGLWQLFYVDGQTFTPDPAASAAVNRGAYLVEGPGHCGQCHSPRNLAGAIVPARALSGGPAFEGEGTVPNITPHEGGIGDWSQAQIVTLLEIGLKPDFDTVGGAMAALVESMAMLPKSDLEAIAAYLRAIAPIPSTVTANQSP